jgi:hypothetical protein
MVRLATDVNFIDLSDPELKINVTNKEMKPFETVPQEEKGRGASRKPTGLWYSCGNEWLEWVRNEMPQWLVAYEYMYALKLNYTKGLAGGKVLKITSDEEAVEFAKKYGARQDVAFEGGQPKMVFLPPKPGDRIEMINWKKVAEDYAGIELCPLPNHWGENLDWVYGWDIPSGCVWDWSGVQDFDLIGYKQDNGKWWIEGPGELGEEREFKPWSWDDDDEDEDEEEEAA